MSINLTIVSRKSRLALCQAKIVQDLLQQYNPKIKIEILSVSTKGDEILDQSLVKIGGKGLFVKELENNLLDGRADIAVHSMKDMPAMLPQGLSLGAILERADPRDAFVSKNYPDIESLPTGAVIGTSSLRRQSQILALRDDLIVASLRGNVQTRIDKLLSKEFDAIILAVAGLERLGMHEWLTRPLSIENMLPAVGQGALGVEYKSDRTDIAHLLKDLVDPHTTYCVQAERAMNAKLDGGCQAPVAGYAYIKDEKFFLKGLVASPDGTEILFANHSSSTLAAEDLGLKVADDLLKQGAYKIIEDSKALWT